jgi:ribonuclease VapC
MIVDSSAVIAMLQREPEAPALADAVARSLDAGEPVLWSAATFVEAAIVADGPRDPVRSARFDAIVDGMSAQIVPVTATHAALARQAYRDFGKGSGHRARLNFGDCLSYALAKERGEPLLYVGDDFARTDIASALE